MKRAILYTRVSTDEQANSGYSLGVQYEQLVKYCELKGIEIEKHFVDDHSAKTFNRPQFNELIAYAKAKQKSIDYLLFVSWDRFSRNASDAYEMLGRLNKMEIEAQAIMQPIDFNVPQNKIMLAIYLALPEVDNDIRSQKIKDGIRGARKLGRWTSNAPVGYKNARDESNRPIIVPHPEISKVVQWAFKEVAKAERSPNVIRMELAKMGLKISKTSFYRLLRNSVYTGRIFVPAGDNEPAEIRTGIHEPIITDELYYEVQMTMDGKNQRINKKTVFKERDELPLRGILSCSNCGKHVTGSASKSRNGTRHYYYHCSHCSKERFRAETVNREMEELLSAIDFSEEAETLFSAMWEDDQKDIAKNSEEITARLKQELSKLEERKTSLKKSFLDEELSARDYTELNQALEARIEEIKSKISKNKAQKSSLKDQVTSAMNLLPNLIERYRNSTVQEKRNLIGSIFPEKFVFKNNEVRTAEINEDIAKILSYTKWFRGNKKGQTKYYPSLSLLVESEGFEPSSKQWFRMSSTCLFFDWFSCWIRTKTPKIQP